MALLTAVVDCAVPRGRYERRPLRTEIVHPLLALAAIGLLVGCGFVLGLSLRGVVAALFCCVLVVITATDLEYRVIPNRIVVPASALVLAGNTVVSPSPRWALAALGASAALLVSALVYPGGMGMGDVKLAFLMGAALGWAVPLALVVAVFASLIPALALLARHGAAAGRTMGIPFGPFLALGSLIALFVSA